MKYRLKKVAVLGSGVMGSGIACHLANVGMEVLMLDIVPKEAGNDKTSRNLMVNTALQTAIKSKPAPLYDKTFASRIQLFTSISNWRRNSLFIKVKSFIRDRIDYYIANVFKFAFSVERIQKYKNIPCN